MSPTINSYPQACRTHSCMSSRLQDQQLSTRHQDLELSLCLQDPQLSFRLQDWQLFCTFCSTRNFSTDYRTHSCLPSCMRKQLSCSLQDPQLLTRTKSLPSAGRTHSCLTGCRTNDCPPACRTHNYMPAFSTKSCPPAWRSNNCPQAKGPSWRSSKAVSHLSGPIVGLFLQLARPREISITCMTTGCSPVWRTTG